MLQLDPLIKGSPSGANFDTTYTTVPGCVMSNGTPLSSPLQYTTADGTITTVSKHTYSNNLVVTDNDFQWCIYHDLVYHPPTHKPFT